MGCFENCSFAKVAVVVVVAISDFGNVENILDIVDYLLSVDGWCLAAVVVLNN